MSAERTLARELWLRIETLHAVTYFGEETQVAARAAGLDGFWVGYFALRAAPLGQVAPGTVDATFANFAPAFVRRWVPRCWELVAPEAALDVRSTAAAETLRRAAPGIEATATAVAESLDGAVAAATAIGRPLFAANRDLAPPDDPVAALWQRCTTLREHRGDGHVAALAAVELSGLEAHVLIAAERGSDPVDLQRTRGWTEDDWAAAVAGLADRGLVDGRGRLRPAGAELRRDVEATTDRLAAAPLAAWSDADASAVLDALRPPAAAVSGAGVLRYPNPIGLPPVGGSG
ncbi:MAG: hypothetical protein KDB04_04035 [Acidimicrobiales bacterium]|nr:hypothetical protein [Acidimicrobiales bacterium]HRW37330.1 hypothetical protein [Aquihabitans sp.]